MLMIKNIDFRGVHKKFQEKLKHNITEIRTSKKVIVTADKTRNLCKMEKVYNKFLSENITYEKSNRNKVNKLNLVLMQRRLQINCQSVIE